MNEHLHVSRNGQILEAVLDKPEVNAIGAALSRDMLESDLVIFVRMVENRLASIGCESESGHQNCRDPRR